MYEICLGVYVSPQIFPSYFKTVPRGTFSLMLIELNQGKYRIKKGNMKDEEKRYYIENYIEILFVLADILSVYRETVSQIKYELSPILLNEKKNVTFSV